MLKKRSCGCLVASALNGKNAHIRVVMIGKHLNEKQKNNFTQFSGEFDANF